jgi:hypothetical protein
MILEVALLVSIAGDAALVYFAHKQHTKDAAELKAAQTHVNAPKEIKQAIETTLNTIRSDESILATHAYDLVMRIRTELRKVL